jgi:hypothetical protein
VTLTQTVALGSVAIQGKTIADSGKFGLNLKMLAGKVSNGSAFFVAQF